MATHEAVAEVEPDEKGLASGVFETANHLLGAIGVAVYATALTTAASDRQGAAGYRAAFLTAAALVFALGLAVMTQARRRAPASA